MNIQDGAESNVIAFLRFYFNVCAVKPRNDYRAPQLYQTAARHFDIRFDIHFQLIFLVLGIE